MFYESRESQLYDQSTDVGESKEVSGKNPDVARKLERQLTAYLNDIDAPMAVMRN